MDWEEQEITVVDDGIHTPDNPYCGDLGCWCHTNVGYHDMVQHPAYQDGDVAYAYSFYEITY